MHGLPLANVKNNVGPNNCRESDEKVSQEKLRPCHTQEVWFTRNSSNLLVWWIPPATHFLLDLWLQSSNYKWSWRLRKCSSSFRLVSKPSFAQFSVSTLNFHPIICTLDGDLLLVWRWLIRIHSSCLDNASNLLMKFSPGQRACTRITWDLSCAEGLEKTC